MVTKEELICITLEIQNIDQQLVLNIINQSEPVAIAKGKSAPPLAEFDQGEKLTAKISEEFAMVKLDSMRWGKLADTLNFSCQEFFNVTPFDFKTLVGNWIHHPIHKPTKIDLKAVILTTLNSPHLYERLKVLNLLTNKPDREEIGFKTASTKPINSKSLETYFRKYRRDQKGKKVSKST